jgi:H+-transporting ATPase
MAAQGENISSNTSSDATPPNHLGATVPTSNLDEKSGHHNGATGIDASKPTGTKVAKEGEDDDEEEEDIDALIDDLESQDGHIDEEEEEEITQPGGAKPVAEDLLQTDTRHGLSSAEVLVRRKKFGLNQMKEEKENLIIKFLGYFIGPIQFVMEVSSRPISESRSG